MGSLLLLDLVHAAPDGRRPQLRRRRRPLQGHLRRAVGGRQEQRQAVALQMVIDFSASWCGPCRFIESAFKEMASRYTDIAFVKIDVDELADVARTWKVGAMPTFVLAKGGKEVSRVVGAKKDELERKIVMFRSS